MLSPWSVPASDPGFMLSVVSRHLAERKTRHKRANVFSNDMFGTCEDMVKIFESVRDLCLGVIKSGAQCARTRKDGSEFCLIHQKS